MHLRHRIRILVISGVLAVLTSGSVIATNASALPLARCSNPVSTSDAASIASLSAAAHTDAPDLGKLDDAVGRLATISQILVRSGDRRGVFAVGLLAAERSAVMPLQHRPATFENPQWAPKLSLALLARFLDALHAEFTGGAVPPHWAEYFAAAQDCSVSGTHAAMIGYNAHLTVDLAYALADVHTTPAQARDFYLIVDSIARNGPALVSETKSAYDADLGPSFRFYFLGEGLDRVAGNSQASNLLLRAADSSYNTLTLASGLALQAPATHTSAVAGVQALYSTVDTAIGVLNRLGG